MRIRRGGGEGGVYLILASVTLSGEQGLFGYWVLDIGLFDALVKIVGT